MSTIVRSVVTLTRAGSNPEVEIVQGFANFVGYRINLFDAAGKVIVIKGDEDPEKRFQLQYPPDWLARAQGLVCEGLTRPMSGQPGGSFSVGCLFYQNGRVLTDVSPEARAAGTFTTTQEIFHIICTFRAVSYTHLTLPTICSV